MPTVAASCSRVAVLITALILVSTLWEFNTVDELKSVSIRQLPAPLLSVLSKNYHEK